MTVVKEECHLVLTWLSAPVPTFWQLSEKEVHIASKVNIAVLYGLETLL